MNINSVIYNNINYIDNTKLLIGKGSSPSFSKQKNGIEKSLNALSAQNKSLIKTTTTIKPDFFLEGACDFEEPRILDYDSIPKGKFVITKDDIQQIKDEYHPVTLPVNNNFMKTEHISNFDFPSGSISISSDLDGTISTDSLWQCSAVAFVDRKHNLQTLMHFCPMVITKNNSKLVEHILSASKPEDLEVTIVAGFHPETDLSVDYLYNKISEFSKGCKIKFANFPDSKNNNVILHNGKLFVSDGLNLEKNINPIERLSFATFIQL